MSRPRVVIHSGSRQKNNGFGIITHSSAAKKDCPAVSPPPPPYTYTPGPKLIYTKPVTTRTIALVCRRLRDAFGSEYTFTPERITQGGILMEKAGEPEGSYKCLPLLGLNWPWISDGDDWEKDRERDLANADPKTRHTTFLKAFYGAACWTNEELHMFEEAFESVGIRMVKFPKAKALISYGELGRVNGGKQQKPEPMKLEQDAKRVELDPDSPHMLCYCAGSPRMVRVCGVCD